MDDISSVSNIKLRLFALSGVTILGGAAIYLYFRLNRKGGYFDSVNSEQKDALLQDEKPENSVFYKEKGNSFFKSNKFDEAIACYTKAIELCEGPDVELATYYQNRAAACEKFDKLEQCLADCDSAIQHNTRYVKAISRRARVLEKLGRLKPALDTVTELCILESFQNYSSLQLADSIVKKLGQEKAEEKFSTLEMSLPSDRTVAEFFGSFLHDPLMTELQQCDFSADSTLPVENSEWYEVLRLLHKQNYAEADKLCGGLLDTCADSPTRVKVQLLYSTFRLLCHDIATVLTHLTDVIESSHSSEEMRINALIKRGSAYLDQKDREKFEADFAKAVEISADNSDIYFHRAQINLSLSDFEKAVEDFNRSCQLEPDNSLYVAYKYAAQFYMSVKNEETSKLVVIEQKMSRLVSAEKNESTYEIYILYNQMLLQLQMFEKNEQVLDKMLQLYPNNANFMVNKAHLVLQWKGDVEQARRLIQKAIDTDSTCLLAHETYGMILVQMTEIKEAINVFQRAIGQCRTREDLARVYSLLESAETQLRVSKKLNIPSQSMF